MFLLRNIFIALCIILLILLVVVQIRNIVKKGDVSKSVFAVILTAIFAIFPGILLYFIKNNIAANLILGIYFVVVDYSLSFILRCIYNMEMEFNGGSRKIFRAVFIFLADVDAVLMLTNCLTRAFFQVEPFLINNQFFCWTFTKTPLFNIHIGICMFMALVIICRLIRDAIIESKLYRLKYLALLGIFLIVFGVNQIYVVRPSVLIDFSLPIFAIGSLLLYALTKFMIPSHLKKNLLSIATDNITAAVFCFDCKNECIYKNQPAKNLDYDEINAVIEKNLASTVDFVVNHEILVIDDVERIFDVEFRRLKDYKNILNGSYIKIDERTKQIRMWEREKYVATHDELTGLYNRNAFFTEAEKIVRANPDVPRYMVATNIQAFKLVNSLFGAKFGDNILKKQAEMLLHANYDDSVIGRISGDKFAMLIAKENFKPELAISNTNIIHDYAKGINFQLNFFLGVYEIANPYESVRSMYDKANLACRNNTDMTHFLSVYDTALMKKIIEEKNILNEFKTALKEDQFCMFLQPQIDSQTGKCVGAEALVRWYDLDKGYRPPSEFIPILEKSGFIYELDRYIWEKAAQKLSKCENPDFYISVNISVKDFYYADLYKVFTELVEKYGISPSRLNLEITETILIGDYKLYKNVLNRLQEYGFSIEMDDFGSGYSSLSTLKDLEMDVLKIDMGFLRKTENEERGRIIISSIVKMAKTLGMQVVCEGVESEAQVKYLSDFGVDLFQGFLYSKPLPDEEFDHKYLESAK